ncbi:MAG TPA: putative Ig domain-containing protein [Planctomycetota bacterium]|nr:putative Ig domain-containing protein [Planctomycetota bacterium]
MPLSFEPNRGQTQSDIKFLSRGDGYTFYVTPTDAVMLLRNGKRGTRQGAALRWSLMDANPNAPMQGIDQLPGTSNYFKGDQEIAGIPNYTRLRSEGVYPGIDMVFYGNNRQLEYDFVVAPGADPATIRMAVDGADDVRLDVNGDLLFAFNGGIVRQKAPVIFQEIDGKRREINGHFILSSEPCDGSATRYISFGIADYDESRPLIIDPVLVFSTIFGDKPNVPAGTSDHSGDEAGNGITVDSTGNIYITGYTNSVEFPLQSPILTKTDNAHNGNRNSHPEFDYDAFVVKFNPDISALIFSTYLCNYTGSFLDPVTHLNDDTGIAIVVNSLNEPYICGNTFSSDFPVKNAISTYSGNGDVFLTKLAATGQNIIFSTYLGGSSLDTVSGMSIDPNSNIYLTGSTASTDFRLANALQTVNGGGTDAFVCKFRNDGAVLLYSTYIGGGGDDVGMGVACDASGNAYVTGGTRSTNFPLAQPFQILKGSGSDAFISKVNPTGTLMVYSTYLGGDGDDQANGIALDSSGYVYVAGFTTSSNFPTVSPTILPVQDRNNGGRDAFVSKLDPFGRSLIFSTYLGGSGNDEAKTIAVDARSAVYIAGVTDSQEGNGQKGFPLAPATNTLQPGKAGGRDGFLAKFNPTGVPLVYSTYYGSNQHIFKTDLNYYLNPGGDQILDLTNPNAGPFPTDDEVRSIFVDNNGNAYVTGLTNGGFYATFGAYSTVAPHVPTAGEDFPAPFVDFDVLLDGTQIKLPAEAPGSGGSRRDLTDVYVSKILDASPIITSAQTARGTLSANFSYRITATNNPDRFNAAGLPAGLTISTSDGQISGIPQITGNFRVVLTASNASGTGAQILFLNISSLPPQIQPPLTATGRVGDVFQYTITALREPGSFTASNLPSGLNLDSITGLISGVPTLEGQFQIPITASNAAGTDSKILVLNILPAAPVVSSSANAQAVLNQAFAYTITATNNPTSYNASGLPLGLSVNQNSGQISGTPTQLGTFNVTITATNGGGTGSLNLNLSVILPNVPVISSPDVATGIVNEPFSFTITANNSPLVYGVEPTALPVGLQLDDATGVISGVPVTPTGNATTFSASNLIGQTGLVGQSVTFGLSSANPGVTRVIGTFLPGSGTIVLTAPLPAVPNIGDSFTTQSLISGSVNSASGTSVAVLGTIVAPSATIDSINGTVSPNQGRVTGIQGGITLQVTHPQGVYNGTINGLNGAVGAMPTVTINPSATQFASQQLNTTNAVNNSLINHFVFVLSGPNTGQERQITAFTNTGTEGVVTNNAFPQSLVQGDTFSILPGFDSLYSNNLRNVAGLIGSTFTILDGPNSVAPSTPTRQITGMTTSPTLGFINLSAPYTNRLATGNRFQITPPTTIALRSDPGLVGATSLEGSSVTITSGAAAGQTRTITNLDTTTGTIIVNAAFTASPAVGDTFTIQASRQSFTSSSLTSESGLVGRTITMTSGAASGQTATVNTFDAANGTISFTPAFTAAPAVNDTFRYSPSATQFTSSSLIGNSGLVGLPLRFTSGANNGTSSTITAFDPVTGRLTVNPAFGAIPSDSPGDTFVIDPSTTTFRSVALIGSIGLVGSNVTIGASTQQITGFDSTSGQLTTTAFPVAPTAGTTFTISPSNSSFASTALRTQVPALNVVNQPLSVSTAPVAGSGTISSAGTAVTGVGTNFTGEFNAGDTIIVGGQSQTVASITSATSLTTIQPFSPALPVGSTFQYRQNRSSTVTGYAGLASYGMITFTAFNPPLTLQPGDSFQIGASTTSITSASLAGLSGLIGRTVTMTSGALNGQSQNITAFDSSAGTITVSPSFTAVPAVGDTFQIVTTISDVVTSLPAVYNQTATNAAGTGRKTLALTISNPPRPSITSPLTANGVVGTPFRYDIGASNNPTSFLAQLNPAAALSTIGLNLITQTGSIKDNPQKGTFTDTALIGSNLPLPGKALLMTSGAANGQLRIISGFDNSSGAIVLNSPLTVLPALNDTFTIETGVISGVPNAAGTYNVDLSAFNSNPQSPGTAQLVLTVTDRQPPVITSPNTATATQNVPFIYQITATSTATVPPQAAPVFTVAGLPAGFAVASPIAPLVGTLSVGNSVTQFTTNSLTGLVNAVGLELIMTSGNAKGSVRTIAAYDSTTSPPTVRVSSAFTDLIGSQVTPAAGDTFEIRGLIQGTPTVTGTFSVTLGADNGVPPAASKTLTLTVQGPIPPTIILPPNDTTRTPLMPTIFGQDGSTFPSFLITATGTQDIRFSASPLPVGLLLDDVNDVILGTPSQPGETIVTITPYNIATNPTAPPPSNNTIPGNVLASSRARQLRIVISPQQPIIRDINSTNTVNGVVGTPIALDPVVSPPAVPINIAGTKPISVSVDNALLAQMGLSASTTDTPTGVLLSISGTPNAASVGFTTIRVSATNSQTVTPVTKDFFFNIVPARPVITSPLSATGTDGQLFTYTVTATGTPPITITTSALPPGLTFQGTTITGRPQTAAIGSHNVTLTASNANGTQSDSKVLVISIAPAPALISSPLTATASEGVPFTYAMTATGTPPFTFSASPMPPGLSVQGANITGTPTAAGTYNIVITANNAVGGDSRLLVLTVQPAAPVITSSLNVSGLDGTPFTYTITTTGTQPMTLSAVGLPPGLGLSGNVISGTPTRPDQYNVQLNALNAQGSDVKILVINIIPAQPVITSVPPFTVRGTPGVPFTYRITATGSQPIAFDALPLPPGLTFSGDTISGTPTVIGQTAVTLFATNALGQDQKTLEIDILFSPPTILRPPPDNVSAYDGVPFSYQVESDGSPPLTFSVGTGASGLPNGLTINPNTGLISGTPNTGGPFPQTFVVSISASNNVPPGIDTKQLAITVAASAPIISGPLLIEGKVGAPLSQALNVTGTAPYTFSITPTLPPGLTLNTTTGVISGTPTTATSNTYTVRANNQAGTGTQTISIVITADVPVINSPLDTLVGIIGVPFTPYTVTAANLPTEFRAFNLPPGLVFNSQTGVLSGTPTALFDGLVTIEAHNSAGVDRKQIRVIINDGSPIITSPLTASGEVGRPFTYTIVAAGLPTISYSASPLPDGLSISGNVISGIPNLAGQFTVNLNASNDKGADTKQLVISIGERPDDFDGDGFPDEVETALGFDPKDGNSTPFNGAAAGPIRSINVKTMLVKLNFSSNGANKDGIGITGTLPFGPEATLASNDVRIVVGGIAARFVVDGRGTAKAPAPLAGTIPYPVTDDAKFTLKEPKDGSAAFTLKMTNHNFKVPLAKINLSNTNVKDGSREIRVFALFRVKFVDRGVTKELDVLAESRKLTTYNAKTGRSGQAKATRPTLAP